MVENNFGGFGRGNVGGTFNSPNTYGMGTFPQYMWNPFPCTGNFQQQFWNQFPYTGNFQTYFGNTFPHTGNFQTHFGNQLPYMGNFQTPFGNTFPYTGNFQPYFGTRFPNTMFTHGYNTVSPNTFTPYNWMNFNNCGVPFGGNIPNTPFGFNTTGCTY